MQTADWPVTLTDGFSSTGFDFNRDVLRLIQVFFRNLTNLFWHGGGKQGGLPFCGALLKNPLHIINKTHTQHFISFIQYQGTEFMQLQCSATHMIHDSPGGPYHNVNAALKRSYLS